MSIALMYQTCGFMIYYPVVNGGSDERNAPGSIHIPYQMRSDLELPRVFQAHTSNTSSKQIYSTYDENLCFCICFLCIKEKKERFLPDIVTETDLI